MNGKIHIPGRQMPKLRPGQQPVIRITPEAYDTLIDIVNESSLPMTKVASLIIIQSKDLIIFDRPEKEEEK